ncbi:hypothetical protein ACJZ2D_011159 [Fusarium nematophilum]
MRTIYVNQFLCRKCGHLVNFQTKESKCGSDRWDCTKHSVTSTVKVHEAECVKCQEEGKKKNAKKGGS